MRTLRLIPFLLVVLPACLAGCSSTPGGDASKMRTVATVGDKPLPVVTGEPGSRGRPTEAVGPPPGDRRAGSRAGSSMSRASRSRSGSAWRPARRRAGRSSGRPPTARADSRSAGSGPGSSYTVIAEWEDGQGLLTGRSTVQAPDTDVRISLAPEDTEPRPRPMRTPRDESTRSRARPVRPEDFLPDPPADRSGQRGRSATRPGGRGLADVPDRRSAARSRASVPRGSHDGGAGASRPVARVGRRPSPTRSPRPTLRPPPASERTGSSPRKAVAPSRRGSAGGRDDGPNPLPPALEPGEESCRARERAVVVAPTRPRPSRRRRSSRSGRVHRPAPRTPSADRGTPARGTRDAGGRRSGVPGEARDGPRGGPPRGGPGEGDRTPPAGTGTRAGGRGVCRAARSNRAPLRRHAPAEAPLRPTALAASPAPPGAGPHRGTAVGERSIDLRDRTVAAESSEPPSGTAGGGGTRAPTWTELADRLPCGANGPPHARSRPLSGGLWP